MGRFPPSLFWECLLNGLTSKQNYLKILEMWAYLAPIEYPKHKIIQKFFKGP